MCKSKDINISEDDSNSNFVNTCHLFDNEEDPFIAWLCSLEKRIFQLEINKVNEKIDSKQLFNEISKNLKNMGKF